MRVRALKSHDIPLGNGTTRAVFEGQEYDLPDTLEIEGYIDGGALKRVDGPPATKAVQPDTDKAFDPDDLGNLTVPALRERAEALGVETRGLRKNDLIVAIQAA